MESKITAKGQMTLPKEAREYLALRSKRKKFVAATKNARQSAPAAVSGD